jgi:hypothetical protein
MKTTILLSCLIGAGIVQCMNQNQISNGSNQRQNEVNKQCKAVLYTVKDLKTKDPVLHDYCKKQVEKK